MLDAEGLSKGVWRAIDDLTWIPGVRGPDGTLDDSKAGMNLRFRVHFAALDTNPGRPAQILQPHHHGGHRGQAR